LRDEIVAESVAASFVNAVVPIISSGEIDVSDTRLGVAPGADALVCASEFFWTVDHSIVLSVPMFPRMFAVLGQGALDRKCTRLYNY